tara:strand:+ start:413 stop:526 length:114 start_codon:yes stop_codon:yes gene_type:complete
MTIELVPHNIMVVAVVEDSPATVMLLLGQVLLAVVLD